jgi:hypothetical protein
MYSTQARPQNAKKKAIQKTDDAIEIAWRDLTPRGVIGLGFQQQAFAQSTQGAI